jgi:hypothetical protein
MLKTGNNVDGSNLDMLSIIFMRYERKICKNLSQDSHCSETDFSVELPEYETVVLKTGHCKLLCGNEGLDVKGINF